MALGHVGRLALGFGVLLVLAQARPENLERWSPYLFGAGLILLVLVLTMGTTAKGAARWLNLGFVKFQPSEMIKLALPMMLAWFFARDNLPPKLTRLGVAFLITLVPTLLVARQPDLGTALLVLGTGFIVMFLAGMSWRLIVVVLAILGAAAPVVWGVMHDYQQNRILTLFNPEADPLGTGYHTIQSMIAVGSGGIYGKGWLNSSQAHLEYLPESSTDFIFAVFAEEFGLIGSLLLMALYLFVVVRGTMIAFLAQSTYNRLLAGGLSISFFLHFFVNVGMVTRHPADRRHSAAHSLVRRHLDRDAHGRVRHPDEHPDPPQDRRILTMRRLPAVIAFGMALAVAPPTQALDVAQYPELEAFIAEMATSRLLRAPAHAPVCPCARASGNHPGDGTTEGGAAVARVPQAVSHRGTRGDGAAFWQRHARLLGRAQAEYGVPPEIIVAILGVETQYGRNRGGYPALDALTTLTLHYPPRAAVLPRRARTVPAAHARTEARCRAAARLLRRRAGHAAVHSLELAPLCRRLRR